MVSAFVPRSVFPKLESIPRTYFLGHHKAGLEKMKSMLSSVDHIIEVRDFRIPSTSINPMLEDALGEKSRYIVYMKRDLGGDLRLQAQKNEKVIARWDRKSRVFFIAKANKNLNKHRLPPFKRLLRGDQFNCNPVTGVRILVVGMPNIGKSTLINLLRSECMKKRGTAVVGADPGVTRKVGGAVKIMQKKNGSIYLHDTPGVFVPYMPDAESMLRLALCGQVKDSIIPATTLADYLLYKINLHNPHIYHKYCPPTNEIIDFLEQMARKSGLLGRGAVPDIERAARRFIIQWRDGEMGKFILDDIHARTLERKQEYLASLGGSMNQAKRAEKAEKRATTRREINALRAHFNTHGLDCPPPGMISDRGPLP
ncbi:hypothetical protein AJ80_00586 [Polytolypa hystricis UAMH7299]|uniref:G domain-containing protein n=1 Tax=Polytolypa hystricis (strain UAMH7299) TaxID=1447883 RepID=A0A2B7Z3U2_POLH7|nr:hypothetical protein AJ80_00586 [Polytolypa hystricis UAMH7299]